MSNIFARLKFCTLFGGSGYGLGTGEDVDLVFGSKCMVLPQNGSPIEISYLELVSIDISGPGTTKTGGGFVGGGFGVSGAIEGMAIASLLNSITTKSTIHTFVSIATHVGEIHFHYAGMEPSALRIVLSPVFTLLRHLDPVWMETRLRALEAQLKNDRITQEQYAHYRERLMAITPAAIRK